jgi:hypothetical protein
MTTISRPWVVRPSVGKLAYAVLFMVVLPMLLWVWTSRLDRMLHLPVVRAPVVGTLIALAGAALAALGIRALWLYGDGLPMSPYPPVRRVTRSIYGVMSHPLYVGAVACAAGVSLGLGSAAGLWLVTPLLGLTAAAYVLGYEGDATLERYGPSPTPPIVRLPAAVDSPPDIRDRASIYILVFLPWLVLYLGVERLGVPPGAVVGYLPGETELPVWPASEAVYAAGYLFTLAVPLVGRTRAGLRTFAVRGLLATGLAVLIYLVVPVIAPAKPFEGGGLWGTLLRWERLNDEPITAFPAFHAIWAILAASVYADRWPRWRAAWWGGALAIGASCITTGMHALVDVAAAWVLAAALLRADLLWSGIRRGAERIANSWREVRVGPIRLMSHGVYAALGVLIGSLIILALLGVESLPWLLLVGTSSIVGAGLWAQFIEGSPLMLRPYGYYGALPGCLIGAVIAASLGADFWLLLAAFAVATPFVQAVGRLRCLVQGCCHGREAPPEVGIRYTHPRSRVTRLSALGGVPVHPTPVYSILANLVIGPILLRLWMVRAPLAFVVGMYFLLSGLARFVEEHYRGEPQTPMYGGLRIYQWLAVAWGVAGAAFTTLGRASAPPPVGLDWHVLAPIGLFAVVGYLAYGADLPASNRRFSRLV